MRNPRAFWVALSVLIVIALNCVDGVGPIPRDPTKLHWRIDSVKANAFQVYFDDIWGSARWNIFVVGGSSDNSQKVFRFDGQSLSEVIVPRPAYPNDDRDFRAVTGEPFGRIWLVGKRDRFNFNGPPYFFDTSFVISSTGNGWNVVLEGLGDGLLSVLPTSTGEVLFGGMFGTLIRYTGNLWTRQDFRTDVGIRTLAEMPNHEIYAFCYSMDLQDPVQRRILRRDASGWTTIDSITLDSPLPRFGIGGAVIFKGDLITCGPGLYRKSGEVWHTLFEGAGSHLFDLTSYGDDGVLACGSNGRAFFYDGISVRDMNLPTKPDARLTGIWSDGTTIALSGYSGDQRYGLFVIDAPQ